MNKEQQKEYEVAMWAAGLAMGCAVGIFFNKVASAILLTAAVITMWVSFYRAKTLTLKNLQKNMGIK